MKKMIVFITFITMLARCVQAEQNEPKIVKIEIIRGFSRHNNLEVYPGKGNVGLKKFPELGNTYWFTGCYGPDSYGKKKIGGQTSYVGLGYHYDVCDTKLRPNRIDFGKNFFIKSRHSYETPFTLRDNKISNNKGQEYTFEPTPLNEFVVILYPNESEKAFYIHKVIPYDGEEYSRYLKAINDSHFIGGTGLTLTEYVRYLFGPADKPEQRKKLEQEVRSRSKLSQEALDAILLDSEKNRE